VSLPTRWEPFEGAAQGAVRGSRAGGRSGEPRRDAVARKVKQSRGSATAVNIVYTCTKPATTTLPTQREPTRSLGRFPFLPLPTSAAPIHAFGYRMDAPRDRARG
jgi:hypothetical protein